MPIGIQIMFYLVLGVFAAVPGSLAGSTGISPRGTLDIPFTPPELHVEASFTEPSGNNVLDARETGHIAVTIKNSGKGAARGLKLRLSHHAGPQALDFDPEVLLAETLGAKKQVCRRLPITAKKSVASGIAKIRAKVMELNGFDADPVVVSFYTREFRAPELSLFLNNVSAGDNHVIDPGEEVVLSFSLKNQGKGRAAGVTVQLMPKQKHIILLDPEQGTKSVRDLHPGHHVQVDYHFIPTKRFAEDKVHFRISAREQRSGRSVAKSIELPVDRYIPIKVIAPPTPVKPPDPTEPQLQALSDVDQFIVGKPPPESPDEHKWAVIIGIEQYREIPPVVYALHDAQAVKAYLTKLAGVPEEQVIFLYNEYATLTDIRMVLEDRLQKLMGAGDILYLYYAGHGVPEKQSGYPYLAPYNAFPESIRYGGYSLRDFYQALAELPASRIIAFVDACYSGIDSQTRPIRRVPKPLPGIKAGNITVITAAQHDQVSNFFEEKNHGLFTYFLLKGLGGSANQDGNAHLTVKELFRYVREQVSRHSLELAPAYSKHQTPLIQPRLEKAEDWAILGSKG